MSNVPSSAESRLISVSADFQKASSDLQRIVEQIQLNDQLSALLEDFEGAVTALNRVLKKMDTIVKEISTKDDFKKE